MHKAHPYMKGKSQFFNGSSLLPSRLLHILLPLTGQSSVTHFLAPHSLAFRSQVETSCRILTWLPSTELDAPTHFIQHSTITPEDVSWLVSPNSVMSREGWLLLLCSCHSSSDLSRARYLLTELLNKWNTTKGWYQNNISLRVVWTTAVGKPVFTKKS